MPEPVATTELVRTSAYDRRRARLLFAAAALMLLSAVLAVINSYFLSDVRLATVLPMIGVMLCSVVVAIWTGMRPQQLQHIATFTVLTVTLALLQRLAVVMFGDYGQLPGNSVFIAVWAFACAQPVIAFVLLQPRAALFAGWTFWAATCALLLGYCLNAGVVPWAREDLRQIMLVVGAAIPLVIVMCRFVPLTNRELARSQEDLRLSERMRAQEKELNIVRERLQLAVEVAGCGTWEWDADARELRLDEAQYRLFGISHAAFDGRRATLLNRVHSEDRPRVEATLHKLSRAGSELNLEYRIVLPSGEVRDIADRAHLERNAGGSLKRMVGISFDVTDVREQFREIQAKQRELELLADVLPSAVAYIELASGRLRYRNSNFATWFDCEHSRELLPDRLKQALDRSYRQACSGEQSNTEISMQFPDGSRRVLAAKLVPHRNQRQAVAGVYLVLDDISHHRENEAALLKDAQIDALTGLHNRRYLDKIMDNEWQRGLRSRLPVSVLMIDIDHFKSYNDSHGHAAGDDCLRRIATAVASQVRRPADIVARYGGEEFTIVLPETALPGAEMVAELVCSTVRSLAIPHAEGEGGIVTLSVGVACVEEPGDGDAQSLIRLADDALYRAKRAGRDCVTVCDQTELPLSSA